MYTHARIRGCGHRHTHTPSNACSIQWSVSNPHKRTLSRFRIRNFFLRQCCFTSTETICTFRDGEPMTATSTFIQLLNLGIFKRLKFIKKKTTCRCSRTATSTFIQLPNAGIFKRLKFVLKTTCRCSSGKGIKNCPLPAFVSRRMSTLPP